MARRASSQAEYRRLIRGNVRALWAGLITAEQFFMAMDDTIRRGLRKAWLEGARECGIASFDELSLEEIEDLNRLITSEISYVFNYALWLEAHDKESGSKLRDAHARADMWVNRYQTAFFKGMDGACKDPKVKWVLDPKKQNCSTCKKLNGKVKRMSQFIAMGYTPATPGSATECGGWKCGCRFEKTDEPMSKGRLPRP